LLEYEMAYPVRQLRDDVVHVPIYALSLAAIQPTGWHSTAVIIMVRIWQPIRVGVGQR